MDAKELADYLASFKHGASILPEDKRKAIEAALRKAAEKA